MSSKYILDSSVWVEYLRGTEKGIKVKNFVEKGGVGVSIIGIAELADKFEREKMNFNRHFMFIRNMSNIIPLSIHIAFHAARIKNQMRPNNPKFSLADGIHLATAFQENATLITADKDFSGAKNVMII